MKTKASRFQQGSGCFICRVCKRNTRSTGRGDNEHVTLCEQCFDLSGEVNALSDMGELCSLAGARSSMKFLTAKGIDAAKLFPEVAAAIKANDDAHEQQIEEKCGAGAKLAAEQREWLAKNDYRTGFKS